ncbi:MAG TPA: hypothetical protein VFA32_03760 [Dehalococcoidia bacterium]|jgi:hypothetical protein|nr:hypothetical protein [Dehalococcoidia bacterium]
MECNVFAVSPQGYSVHFKMEVGEEGRLYKDFLLLLDRLHQDGFTSRDGPTTAISANGHRQGPEKAAQPPEEPEVTHSTPQPHWCQTHGREFKRRGQNGRSWYSHKTADGQWCREGS